MAELKLQRHVSPQCMSRIPACGSVSSYEQEYKNIQALDTLKECGLDLAPHVRTEIKEKEKKNTHHGLLRKQAPK